MKALNEKQYNLIKGYLPVQRGNVKISNLTLINAVLYIAENGCKWRSLPEKYGNWHTIYTRLKRWAERGVLERLFIGLQKENLIRVSVTCLGLDSTSVKVHPDAAGALKKTDLNPSANPVADGLQKFIWFPRMIDLD
jgi:transposase